MKPMMLEVIAQALNCFKLKRPIEGEKFERKIKRKRENGADTYSPLQYFYRLKFIFQFFMFRFMKKSPLFPARTLISSALVLFVLKLKQQQK